MTVYGRFDNTSTRLIADPSIDEMRHLRNIVAKRELEVCALERELDAARRRQHALESRLEQLEDQNTYQLSVSTAAHSFNNMLTVIVCNVQLLVKQLDTTDEAAFGEILQATRHARKVALRLLRWNQEDEVTLLDPNTVVQDAVTLVRPTLHKQLELGLYFAPDLPQIRAPERAMLDALVNVAFNARDATPSGRLCFITYQDDGEIRIDVTDNGAGMDEATKARLFEPYFTTKVTGHGVGMSSIPALFERAPGRVEIASAPGEGTAVSFAFPIAR